MKKEKYIAPEVTVVEFRQETGYLLSGGNGTPLDGRIELMMYEEGNNNYRETEVFSKHNDWVQGNSSSFWD